MKWCTQLEVRDGEVAGMIDFSAVSDDHEFGPSDGGTRLHVEARLTAQPLLRAEGNDDVR